MTQTENFGPENVIHVGDVDTKTKIVRDSLMRGFKYTTGQKFAQVIMLLC